LNNGNTGEKRGKPLSQGKGAFKLEKGRITLLKSLLEKEEKATCKEKEWFVGGFKTHKSWWVEYLERKAYGGG